MIAFGSCLIDNWLEISSIGIHSGLNGNYRLTFPARKIRNGSLQYFFKVVNEPSRQLLLKAFVDEIERLQLFPEYKIVEKDEKSND